MAILEFLVKRHDAEEAKLIISDIVPTLAEKDRNFRASLGKEGTPLREVL